MSKPNLETQLSLQHTGLTVTVNIVGLSITGLQRL